MIYTGASDSTFRPRHAKDCMAATFITVVITFKVNNFLLHVIIVKEKGNNLNTPFLIKISITDLTYDSGTI